MKNSRLTSPTRQSVPVFNCNRQSMGTAMRFDRNYFERIHQLALPVLPALVHRILPQGKVVGHEYLALNPRRADKELGSFRVNLHTGKWADFAVNASGGDVTSLVAYVLGLSQSDAAQAVMRMIGGVS